MLSQQLQPGDIIYRNATVPVRLGIGTAGQVLTVNSGATAPQWSTPAGGTWTTYTPTVTAETGTITTSSATGRYIKVGTLCTVTTTVTLTNVGSATGSLIVSLPFTAANVNNFAGSVKETAVNGDGGTVWTGSTTQLYSRRIGVAQYWWTNGAVLILTLAYETV